MDAARGVAPAAGNESNMDVGETAALCCGRGLDAGRAGCCGWGWGWGCCTANEGDVDGAGLVLNIDVCGIGCWGCVYMGVWEAANCCGCWVMNMDVCIGCIGCAGYIGPGAIAWRAGCVAKRLVCGCACIGCGWVDWLSRLR